MLESLISRNQGIISSCAVTSTLESGLRRRPHAVSSAASAAQHADYLAAVLAAAAPSLRNATRDAAQPLDRFSIHTGIDAARAVPVQVADIVKTAYDAINASLALQARKPDGGHWYYVYPEWTCLDGVFSLLPFMAAAAVPDYTDMAPQVHLLAEHCYDRPSGLYVHGYDWARKAVWADPATGASPHVRGRSLGWFLAGLVQTWEALGCPGDDDDSERSALCAGMKRIVSAEAPRLASYADGETGAWWQLPTLGAGRGNFLESSSTAPFVFSLLKAKRIGLVAGAGGGDDGGDGDGIRLKLTATIEYYTSRPIVLNGLVGEVAFVPASLEVEKLAA